MPYHGTGPDDEYIPIPDEHYIAIGKVADAWADLEFDIHLEIDAHRSSAGRLCDGAAYFLPSPIPRRVRSSTAIRSQRQNHRKNRTAGRGNLLASKRSETVPSTIKG